LSPAKLASVSPGVGGDAGAPRRCVDGVIGCGAQAGTCGIKQRRRLDFLRRAMGARLGGHGVRAGENPHEDWNGDFVHQDGSLTLIAAICAALSGRRHSRFAPDAGRQKGPES
jgi:hypothetical protein